MAKRFYYICDPNLPVATKKRHSTGVRRALVFHLHGGAARLVGSCRYVLALSHRGSSIAVDLSMAKKLSSLDIARVCVYDVTLFDPECYSKLEEEVTTILNAHAEPWFAPASVDWGDTIGEVDTVDEDTMTVTLEFADTSHTH